jgi:hypothetical protein
MSTCGSPRGWEPATSSLSSAAHCLYEVAGARAHCVAIDALGRNPLASTPFHRVVDPEHQRTIARIQIPDQQTQQHLGLLWLPGVPAVPQAVPVTRPLISRVFMSADGSPWRRAGGRSDLQLIGSYTRIRCWVIDPALPDHSALAEALGEWIGCRSQGGDKGVSGRPAPPPKTVDSGNEAGRAYRQVLAALFVRPSVDILAATQHPGGCQ